MREKTRKCAIRFFHGVAASVSAQVAAALAIATATFLWEFAGHVVADVAVHVIRVAVGH